MNEQPTHLDLFSGIGGFALAAGWAGFQTIGFCEIEPYAQAVLKKHWPQVPIHSDIRKLQGGGRRIDLLTGGFPCQPFSVAGKRRGKEDDRHLWPEMLRIAEESKPSWIVGENVAGIIAMELDKVCADLEGEGYEVEPIIVPACAVDAPHRRDRVWIVAHSRCELRQGGKFKGKNGVEAGEKNADFAKRSGQAYTKNVADTKGCKSWQSSEWKGRKDIGGRGEDCGGIKDKRRKDNVSDTVSERRCGGATWLPEPDVGRVAHGIPNRVHRLKGLGNAIVPQVAFQILKGIREVMEQNGEN